MNSWAALAEAAPDFAEVGKRLLVGDDGVAIAFLGTVKAAGTIHLAPVCPIFCGPELYLSAAGKSPKVRDLRGDGRYALHAFLGTNDEEFQLRGTATEVTDAAERDRVHGAILFPSFEREDPIFRFAIESVLWAYWERVGQPDIRVVRRRWPAS
jgi:general stress protein 26